MNVLMIFHESSANGTSRSMLDIIDQLNYRIKFYACVPSMSGDVYEKLSERNVEIIYCPMGWWMSIEKHNILTWVWHRIKWYFCKQFYNRILADRIAGIVSGYKIDVIHTSTSVINIGGLLSKKLNVPHLWHFREFGEEDFSLYPLCTPGAFDRFVKKHTDAVVFNSNAVRNKYMSRFDGIQQYVVYNGVGEKNFSPDRNYRKDGDCIFLIAGVLSRAKGQDIAVMAVNELLKRGYTNFKLYIAGRGDNSWLTSMDCYQKKYISFLGQVEDMPTLRKQADVGLVCSRCEAFGRVTVEAMLSGMPVIGSNSGGTPELINDGLTGYLFRSGDYMDLADKMQHYLDNRDEIETMGVAAQKYAKENFMIEKCADAIFDIYKKISEEDAYTKP